MTAPNEQFEERKTNTKESILILCCGVIVGTIVTLTVKWLYGMQSIDQNGQNKLFEKPLFTTLLMTLAMALSLPTHLLVVFLSKYLSDSTNNFRLEEQQVLLKKTKNPFNNMLDKQQENPIQFFYPEYSLSLLFPSMADVLGTVLAKVGLLYTCATVYQFFKCFSVVIVGLGSQQFLNTRITTQMKFGLAVVTLSLAIISTGAIFDDADSHTSHHETFPALGILLLLASCMSQGAQFVSEEVIMSNYDVPPLFVVGMEGVYGLVIMLFAVIPLAQLFGLEDTYGTYVMIHNNHNIAYGCFLFFSAVYFYNLLAIFVTKTLSAVWHSMMDVMRVGGVWLASLCIYYAGFGNHGEEWNWTSWITLLGLIVLGVGTTIYNGTLTLNNSKYLSWLNTHFHLLNGETNV